MKIVKKNKDTVWSELMGKYNRIQVADNWIGRSMMPGRSPANRSIDLFLAMQKIQTTFENFGGEMSFIENSVLKGVHEELRSAHRKARKKIAYLD